MIPSGVIAWVNHLNTMFYTSLPRWALVGGDHLSSSVSLTSHNKNAWGLLLEILFQ